MKYINVIICSIVILVILSSCEEMFGDFLDKAPSVDVTEDTIFSSKKEVDTFISGMYEWGITNDLAFLGGSNPSNCITAAATDEGESQATWFWPNNLNKGNVTTNNSYDNQQSARWIAIRKANILLERIGEVPTDQSYIDQVKGEALVIRALNYFDMLRFYGGVPIVDHRFAIGEEYKIPRSTLKETVDFIVKDCSDAALLLPDFYPTNLFGRITKGAALILKAKTLLFAASPQFNTGAPYLDLAGHNDLICYGNSDNNRWQIAADAAKAVLDWAPSGNINLVTSEGVNMNYRAVWEKPGNSELILTYNFNGLKHRSQPPFQFLNPTSLYGTWGVTVPLNFIKFYRKADGTPQTWDSNGGNDLNEKYAEMEPRFHQTFTENLDYWNAQFPIMEYWQADVANGIKAGRDATNNPCGIFMHKLIPYALTITNQVIPYWTVFRLGEAYLYYAEALNESQGPVPAAYAAINKIRNRAGLPDLSPGLSKEQFREEVRLEETIEMAYDDHRFWNLRRWLIADTEGVMKGNMYGIKIYKIPGTTPQKFRYEPYVFEVRSFNKNFYLHPFLQSEVNKGYLIQNPGW